MSAQKGCGKALEAGKDSGMAVAWVAGPTARIRGLDMEGAPVRVAVVRASRRRRASCCICGTWVSFARGLGWGQSSCWGRGMNGVRKG